MHDRFGFYICWGCLCWITGFYTSTALWLVNNPLELSYQKIILIFTMGCLSIWFNYDADRQRQEFRATEGKCKIWGETPKTILCEYITEDGLRRKSLLLYSGWWGIARHFNYLPELTCALCWALPAGTSSFFPYAYFFLFVIIIS